MINLNLLLLQFLLAIAGVESNHGKDLNHRTIASGIQAGDSAIGQWALMPNTVLMLKKDLPRFKRDTIYQKQVAKIYALKILNASRGCPLTASILWLKGPNGTPTPLDYNTPRYKRFVAEWQAFSQTPVEKDPVILQFCQ